MALCSCVGDASTLKCGVSGGGVVRVALLLRLCQLHETLLNLRADSQGESTHPPTDACRTGSLLSCLLPTTRWSTNANVHGCVVPPRCSWSGRGRLCCTSREWPYWTRGRVRLCRRNAASVCVGLYPAGFVGAAFRAVSQLIVLFFECTLWRVRAWKWLAVTCARCLGVLRRCAPGCHHFPVAVELCWTFRVLTSTSVWTVDG